MAQAEEDENRAKQQLAASKQMSKFSKDRLQRLVSGEHFAGNFEDPNEDAEEEEIELSLGLSMNGRFGVDPRRAKKLALKRSSSIADFTTTTTTTAKNPIKDEEDDTACLAVPKASPTPLARTCSLPTETEQEWRKRKEMQTLRRMEAKRKRLEKQRNLKAARDRSLACLEENGEVEDNKRGIDIGMVQQEQCLKVTDEFSRMGMFSWVSGNRASSGLELNGDRGNGVRAGVDGLPPQPLSQRSTGSQGSGSSGISESESPKGQGLHKCMEARSPASAQQSEQKSTMINREKSGDLSGMVIDNQKSDKPPSGHKEAKEASRNVLEDMPCVSTKGDGPNGRRIEGFLYRYRKGEEVRIVCVCHGSFLSPAEFVKHAGGGDVAHPLKHIVVNPTFF